MIGTITPIAVAIGPAAPSRPATIKTVFFVSVDSPVNACAIRVTKSIPSFNTGNSDSINEAPANLRLSSAVDILPDAVCESRFIAPAANPPSAAIF